MGKAGRPVNRFVAVLRQRMPELAERHKVKSLGVFGSYVRNEQKKGSDLDVLVEFYETVSLFDYIDLKNYLSDLLGVKVDLVMKEALKPHIGKHILREVINI